MKYFKILILIGLSCTVFACGKDYLYEKKQALPNGTWAYRDTLNFDFEIADTFKIYNLYLEIEHADDYPYQNIYVMTHTKFPTGERPAQRINIDLAANNGVWMGEKSGKNFTHRVDLQQNAYFNRPGKYTLTLAQFMRRDSLPIRSVRFAVEDAKQTRDNIQVKKGERPKQDQQKKYLVQ